MGFITMWTAKTILIALSFHSQRLISSSHPLHGLRGSVSCDTKSILKPSMMYWGVVVVGSSLMTVMRPAITHHPILVLIMTFSIKSHHPLDRFTSLFLRSTNARRPCMPSTRRTRLCISHTPSTPSPQMEQCSQHRMCSPLTLFRNLTCPL